MTKKLLPLSLTTILFFAAFALAHEKVVVVPLAASTPPPQSKLIFVTNGMWTGNLGGLTGADSKCNAEAKSLGFKGTFQALLGTLPSTPQHRSIHHPITYQSAAGGYLNSGYHDLFASGVDTAVNTNPYMVWTGLNADGTAHGENCLAWTSSLNINLGRYGMANAVNDPTWLSMSSGICSDKKRIYCIEQ